jgi:hypothetical protein
MQTIAYQDFLKTLKNIAVGYHDKSIVRLRTIFESGIGTTAVKNSFIVYNFSFYSQDVNVLSSFQGNLFESACTLNMGIIRIFLNHILKIICNNNIDLYSYIINRILLLIQKLGSKTETTFVIIEEQDTDENQFLLMLFLSYSDVMRSQMKAALGIS